MGIRTVSFALRVDDGSPWGLDFGTCFAPVSPAKDRESTCSSTRIVSVTDPTAVLVYAFGYSDDTGSADSGKIDAKAFVTAVRVK
ncbi:MAG: hypothetical protein QM714_03525 [Nocardioides sp.]|uniref:hypothetical protein n=1 Tax=Nocardioides sp. TaxID=35761 RepID=UPI0039E41F17